MGEAFSLEGETDKAIEEFRLTTVYDSTSPLIRKRLAEEYLKKGLLSETIEQAEIAIQLDSKYSEVHFLLGRVYQTLKMYRLGDTHYHKYIELEPKKMEGYVALGSLLAEQKKYQEAEVYFQKIIDNAEKNKLHLVYFYIGSMRIKQGGMVNYKKAEKSYLKGVQHKPESEDLVLALGQLYELQGNQPKAVKLIESYQEKFGPKRDAAQYLSQIFLEQELYEKALKQLTILEQFSENDLNTKVRIALILIENKQYDKAIPKLEEILTLAPDSDKVRFYLGAVYEETKQDKLAIRHFSRIGPVSTYYADAMIHVGYLHKKGKRLSDAIETMEEAIKYREDVVQFYAFYASLLDEKREYKTATKMLLKAVERFPTSTQLRFYLGSMHDRTGNTDLTIKEMKKILDIEADHVQAMNYLAYTYAELNIRLDEAEALVRRAHVIKPDDGYILDTLGWVLFKKGQTRDSIKFLEAAFKTKISESVVADHLGDAYYRYELVDKAKRMYLRAAEIEKDKDKIQKIRKKITSIEEIQKKRQPASAK